MCGIFGIVTTKSRNELIEPLNRAAQSLTHRGPDDGGIEFINAGNDALTVAFAHRRLSILDLSPAGHQPMRDDANGNWARAAERLGMHRSNLHHLARRLGLR